MVKQNRFVLPAANKMRHEPPEMKHTGQVKRVGDAKLCIRQISPVNGLRLRTEDPENASGLDGSFFGC